MVRMLKIVACIAGFAAVSSALQASPFVSVKGYSYDPPAGWTATETKGATDSMYAATSTSVIPPSISVAIQRLPPGTSTASGLKVMHRRYFRI